MDLFTLFMDLPAELRIRIYEAHFAQESEVDIPTVYHERTGYCGIWKNKQPPITCLNRQIRDESLRTFYRYCTFRLESVCSPCIPDDVYERCIAVGNIAQPYRRPHGGCECIPHYCYRHSKSTVRHSRYLKWEPWRWLESMNPRNLALIRKMELFLPGDPTISRKGYNVVLLQHLQSKRVTIDPQDSYWQDDMGIRGRKVEGSSPAGQAIIAEIHESALATEDEDTLGRGLTIRRIYKVLEISYRHSIVQRRDPQDYAAYGRLHNVLRDGTVNGMSQSTVT